MQRSDESIRKICVASIRRHTFKPINYPLTTVYDSETLPDIDIAISAAFEHFENELPIAVTLVDNNNWTLITTRRIVSNIKGDVKQALTANVIKKKWNDFKGYKDKSTTTGQVILDNSTTLDILIETGNASMIMIYGIMTLTGREIESTDQINKTLSRYKNRGFFDNPE